MRISEITLKNFRSFGPSGTTILLNDLTAFIGSNACGKTVVLSALQRLFGIISADRDLKPEDFHLPRGQERDAIAINAARTLSVEIKIQFPELEDVALESSGDAVAECFKQMVVTKTGETPFCCVRLEGSWTNSNLPGGEIEQHTYWIKPGREHGSEEKLEMRPYDRSRIHVHYVPATRDPLKQFKQVSSSIMSRLLQMVHWSDSVREDVAKAAEEIRSSFASVVGVEAIQDAISENWRSLHDSFAYSGVKIRPVTSRFEEMLRQVEAVFSPSPGGTEDPLERLSDGQKSLFYLALVKSVFDIEEQILGLEDDDRTFDRDKFRPPSLTLFAFEEPENHISPHYLARIVDSFRKISDSPRAQVLLTSHSPSIVHRIFPEEIRHLRLHLENHTSIVRSILLPPETDESYKFIREAVIAFPELYFSRFVVLGEGDSEEIVLTRLSESIGLPIDRSFVSIVPLGGRHVNHFWRLLKTLDIPHVTLLDFDLERHGGGWGRIKYVLKQLLLNETPRTKLLAITDKDGNSGVLSDEELEGMHEWSLEPVKDFKPWLESLENHGVYFSTPLDLDFRMLSQFHDAYCFLEDTENGPTIPEQLDEDYAEKRESVIRSVLKDSGGDGSTYSEEKILDFFWYRYLFLGRGKPATHLRALSRLSQDELRKSCPPSIKRMLLHMKTELGVLEDEVE